jgi:plasmid stabilization system protein ParE
MPGARADLDGVLEDVAERYPGFERDLYEDVVAAAASLATLSERGRLVPELRSRRTRELFVREYRLIYEVDDDQVSIVAFMFGRRDFATWWRERQRR